MAHIDETQALTQRRYVSDIHIELSADGYAQVKTGVQTPVGFIETAQSQVYPLASAPPGALGTAIAPLMSRLGLDPATTTLRQLIRAVVGEVMDAQIPPAP